MSEYEVRLPTPHAKQGEFISSEAKRKVIVAGRRGGKTTGCAMLAAEKALDGRRVLEAAPTAEQTSAFWDAITSYFDDPIGKGAMYKHETKRLLELPNGGVIRCKTAHNADTLRGDYGDLVILDEFQQMHPDALDKVVLPMLLDNDGDLVLIGTPARRNHYYRMYQMAKVDETGRWAWWHFTSHDNPHLSKKALEEITQDMTTEAYRQEIMAEFLENEGVVFRNITACMKALKTTPKEHERHRIVIGVDWGKHHDFTCISAGCIDCMCEVDRERFNKIDYTYQRERLKEMVNKWSATSVLAESNAMGEPIIDQLKQEGVPVKGFQTTATSKPQLIENLALVLERTEWQFADDTLWTAEMEAYERKVSAVTGRSQYSAPTGIHDDTVIARALMVWAGTNNTVSLPEQPVHQGRFNKYDEHDGEGSRFGGMR